MSDLVWQSIIAGVVTIVLAWMSNRTKAAVEKTAAAQAVKTDEVVMKAKEVAMKTEKVRTTLVELTAKTDTQLGEIHTLVNANMGKQLKISAVALRRVADMGKHERDIAAAILAEQALVEHEAKQALVDANHMA